MRAACAARRNGCGLIAVLQTCAGNGGNELRSWCPAAGAAPSPAEGEGAAAVSVVLVAVESSTICRMVTLVVASASECGALGLTKS